MGRKAKVSYEIKICAVEKYLNATENLTSIAKEISVNESSIRAWVRAYQALGTTALLETSKNICYTSELKIAAIQDYLSGNGTLGDIQIKYGLKSNSQLRCWIKKYNGHEKLKSANFGGKLMANGRKTTFEERIEIVKHCIESNRNYHATAQHYQVSYQQVYSWVQKYDQNGVEALQDRRGKTKPEIQMSELDKLRAQNKLLEAENRRKQMEIDYLKKLEELERRRS